MFLFSVGRHSRTDARRDGQHCSHRAALTSHERAGATTADRLGHGPLGRHIETYGPSIKGSPLPTGSPACHRTSNRLTHRKGKKKQKPPRTSGELLQRFPAEPRVRMAPTATAAEQSQQHTKKAVGLAALDASGHLSPLAITRRYVRTQATRSLVLRGPAPAG